MNRDMFKQKMFSTSHVAHTALSYIPAASTVRHKTAINPKRVPGNHLHAHLKAT